MNIFHQRSFIGIIALLSMLLLSSCEYDSDKMNYHELSPLPNEIEIGINLANVSPDEVIYIGGSTSLYYQIHPSVGIVESVEFKLDGRKESIQDGSTGAFWVHPSDSEVGKILNLEVNMYIKGGNGSLAEAAAGYYYSAKASYKIQYVRITAADFVVKKVDMDEVVLAMKDGVQLPFNLVVEGELITNTQQIKAKRQHFPYGTSVKIYILPEYVDVSTYESYYYVEVGAGDESLPEIAEAVSVSYTINPYNDHLYATNWDEVYIYDKELNFLRKRFLSTFQISAVAQTGWVVCYSYSGITVFEDDTFARILSRIDISPSRYTTGGKNLFVGEFENIDVFDLSTGNLKYSFDSKEYIVGLAASEDGKYLYVQQEEKGKVYQLGDYSATFLYETAQKPNLCYFHPFNKHHIILNKYRMDGRIDVFDVESGKVIFSFEGELQSIDPVTGNMLFYDKDYGKDYENYANHIIDRSYKPVYTFENSTSSLYGPFQLFNNKLIKSTYWVDINYKLPGQ